MSFTPPDDVMVIAPVAEHPTMSSILDVRRDDGTRSYVEVRSNGAGRFWATRDPDFVCAVFGRSVFWVDTRDPASAVGYQVNVMETEVPLFVASHDLLLYHGGAGIEAYGPDGLRWRTGPLAFDEIESVVLDGNILRGVADSIDDQMLPFTVDLATGVHEGGFSWEARGIRPLE
jgi:hypothetical protein